MQVFDGLVQTGRLRQPRPIRMAWSSTGCLLMERQLINWLDQRDEVFKTKNRSSRTNHKMEVQGNWG